MYGNGVKIGMVIIHLRLSLILWDLYQGNIVCYVVVGTAMLLDAV